MYSVYYKKILNAKYFVFIIFNSPILYSTKKTELKQFYVFILRDKSIF